MQVDGFIIRSNDAPALAALAEALGHRVWLKDFDPRDAREQAFVEELRKLSSDVIQDPGKWIELRYGKGSLVINWKERDKAPIPEHQYVSPSTGDISECPLDSWLD